MEDEVRALREVWREPEGRKHIRVVPSMLLDAKVRMDVPRMGEGPVVALIEGKGRAKVSFFLLSGPDTGGVNPVLLRIRLGDILEHNKFLRGTKGADTWPKTLLGGLWTSQGEGMWRWACTLSASSGGFRLALRAFLKVGGYLTYLLAPSPEGIPKGLKYFWYAQRRAFVSSGPIVKEWWIENGRAALRDKQ